jgi:hypothetical protein
LFSHRKLLIVRKPHPGRQTIAVFARTGSFYNLRTIASIQYFSIASNPEDIYTERHEQYFERIAAGKLGRTGRPRCCVRH